MGQFGAIARGAVFCAECGASLVDGARYCIRCGTPTSGPETITLGDATYVLAGFGRRLSGHLLDSALAFSPWMGLFILTLADNLASECTAGPGPCVDYHDAAFGPYSVLLLLRGVPLVYWALWNSLGSSPGKWAFGMKLVKDRGRAPGLKAGCIRALVAVLASGTALYLGYLWALRDRERQTWHDHAARTWVVRK